MAGANSVLSRQKQVLKNSKNGSSPMVSKKPGSRSKDVPLDFLKNKTIRKNTPPKGFNNLKVALTAARLAWQDKSIDLIAKRTKMSESSVGNFLNIELRKAAMKGWTTRQYIVDHKRCFAPHKRQA